VTTNVATCDRCGAEVLWVVMEDTGKKMPIDVVPADNGTVVILGATARVLTKAQREKFANGGRRFYRPHFGCKPTARVLPPNVAVGPWHRRGGR
jgi:hypothetical protein